MKQESASSDPVVLNVQDERLARALVLCVMNDELTPFRSGPKSPQEVAQASGEPIYKVLRLIHRWVERGVLHVASETKRAGRPIRHYALAHQRYFIPNHVLSIEEVMDTLAEPIRQEHMTHFTRALKQESGVTGTQVNLTENQQWALLAQAPNQLWDTEKPDGPVINHTFFELQLDYADARAMQGELDELFKRYANRGGAQTYLFGLQMAPKSSPGRNGG